MFFAEYRLQSSAARLKKVLPNLVSSQQAPYAHNSRFIGERGRLRENIIGITDICNKEWILVTMYVEKAFASLLYTFLISVLKKIGFGNNFVSWIKTLISKQESCVINGGNTTQYFQLKKGVRG